MAKNAEYAWRVTVRRWSDHECGSSSEWLLDKWHGGGWKPARRDNPADAAAFAAVDEMDPLRWPKGESFFNFGAQIDGNEVCAGCGQVATGYATIDGARYCHGEDSPTFDAVMHEVKHGRPPTCYEQANGRPGPLARQWLRGEVVELPARNDGSGA